MALALVYTVVLHTALARLIVMSRSFDYVDVDDVDVDDDYVLAFLSLRK